MSELDYGRLRKVYSGGSMFGCDGCQGKYNLIARMLTDHDNLRSQLAAKEREVAERDAVIRELVVGMTSITGSGGISKAVHITVDHSTWTKALALVGGEKGEGR